MIFCGCICKASLLLLVLSTRVHHHHPPPTPPTPSSPPLSLSHHQIESLGETSDKTRLRRLLLAFKTLHPYPITSDPGLSAPIHPSQNSSYLHHDRIGSPIYIYGTTEEEKKRRKESKKIDHRLHLHKSDSDFSKQNTSFASVVTPHTHNSHTPDTTIGSVSNMLCQFRQTYITHVVDPSIVCVNGTSPLHSTPTTLTQYIHTSTLAVPFPCHPRTTEVSFGAIIVKGTDCLSLIP